MTEPLPESSADLPLLLDTHVLLWLLLGNERLHPFVRDEIQRAAAQAAVMVSAITPWEIAMLVAKGRLDLRMDVGAWIDSAMSLPGVQLVPLSPRIAVESTRLSWNAHADPADRILMATAHQLGATLVTADSVLLGYAGQRHFRAMAAEGRP